MSAEHWIAHGQTTVGANTVVDDPDCNTPGTTGEIPSLPYDVPTDKILVLRAQGVEGTKVPNAAIFPWIGEDFPANYTVTQKPGWRISRALYTAQSNGGSKPHDEILFLIPGGSKVHAALTNGTLTPTALAWFLRGYLVPNTEDPLEAIRGLP